MKGKHPLSRISFGGFTKLVEMLFDVRQLRDIPSRWERGGADLNLDLSDMRWPCSMSLVWKSCALMFRVWLIAY